MRATISTLLELIRRGWLTVGAGSSSQGGMAAELPVVVSDSVEGVAAAASFFLLLWQKNGHLF